MAYPPLLLTFETSLGISKIQNMEQNKKKQDEKKKENSRDNEKTWIDKAEEFIDDTADKIHESKTYKKADQSVEEATKKLFRKAGKLWGKSERYFKSDKDKKDSK